MRTICGLIVAAALTLGAAAPPTSGAERPAPTAVIVDTDIAGDADDAGALAMLNALHNQRKARILAVMAGSPSEWSAPAIDAINTYYGNGDIPIGTQRPPYLGHVHDMSRYRHIAENFPNDLRSGDNAPESTSLYRKVLANQPDHSVVLVSIGLLTNMERLLRSGPDEHSSLSGYDLVSRKVRLVAVMGGAYPTSAVHPNGHEHNFDEHAGASAAVVAEWPTRMVFAGWEIGRRLLTGARLVAETPAANPVREAYVRFGFQGPEGRFSWDQVAAWYGVCGTASLFAETGQSGSNHVDAATGANEWRELPERDHAYLVTAAQDEAIEDAVEELMVQPPNVRGAAPRSTCGS